jgi:hypothetical protein
MSSNGVSSSNVPAALADGQYYLAGSPGAVSKIIGNYHTSKMSENARQILFHGARRFVLPLLKLTL